MTETPGNYDVETLKQIASGDQRSQSEKERDAAIAKCAEHTANHYLYLAKAGLPEALVAELTLQFQEAYLNALLFGDVEISLYAGEGDE